VIETIVEKVEAKPEDKPEQDEQSESSQSVFDVIEEKVTEGVSPMFTETITEKVETKSDMAGEPEQVKQPVSFAVVVEGKMTEVYGAKFSEVATAKDTADSFSSSNMNIADCLKSLEILHFDEQIGQRRDEITIIDTRKSSLSTVEISTLDDDSPLLTDFTTSSITYVSDRIDSSSLDLMVAEPSMSFLKIGHSIPPDEKKNEVLSPGSCLSFTTTTSENIESISHDVEKCVNSSLQPEVQTEYERSVSLSDNAASDYSNESATKYNLPYDTESDGHDVGSYISMRKRIKPQESVTELKQVKSTKLISVDQRHGSASPQSDITEHTESVSYVDSIIDSTNYESALKLTEVKQEARNMNVSTDAYKSDENPNLLTTNQGLKERDLVEELVETKTTIQPVESSQVKRRSKAKTTVTKVNLHKQTPIDISKRSARTVDIRMGASESTVMVSKSSTTTSRISTTATRSHGYMQSTLSRDQKVLRPLSLTDSTHSSPSKTSVRSSTAQSSTAYSSTQSSERKSTKSSKEAIHFKHGIQEKLVVSSSPITRKVEMKDIKSSKSGTSRSSATATASTTSTMSTSSVSSQSRPTRSTITRKLTPKLDSKEQPAVKKADKEQANLVTKSTLPAAVKTSKDRVNKSLIPVKVQPNQRETTPSPSKTLKSKAKSVPIPKAAEQQMSKPMDDLKKSVKKKDQSSVQLVTKSIPRITNTVRKESSKQIIDDIYRCKSAMHYSYKDAVTFEHTEVPSSLPSSPSRLNKSSSNSTNVLTSEVFTRTIDSSKSIEVIYKQPSTSHELYRRVNEYRYNDTDMNFIETTDSSLSDSIALPSSSSEQESDATGKQKRSGSPEGSPKQTSSSSAVTTMTTLTNKKNQQQHYPHHPTRAGSKHGTPGKRARAHSPAEPRYRKSDIWSRTDPPASSQELPDTSEDSDMYYYHQQHYQLQQQQLPPVAGIADRRLATSLDGIVLESSISPILDFRASTPPRMKYKFDYDSSMFTATISTKSAMSDIPLISITKECSDDEELSSSSPTNKMNIEDALTDTEDLIMDGGQREKKVAPSTPIPPAVNNLSLIEALQTPLTGAVTDVEDCSDTSDEEERDKKPTREVEISLDDFLDQGYVDEMTKSDQRGAKPKILTRSSSKATEGGHKTLKVCVDASAALTDCEDCAMSGDEDAENATVIPDCPEDILMRVDADNGMVDIHNAVRRRQEKHLPKMEPVQSSSSDSDEPECKVVRHRKPHRKAVPSENRNTSDCENILMSEEESTACAAKPPCAGSVFDADEITIETSDHENEQSTVFPEINICFVTDDNELDQGRKLPKANSSRPSSLSVGQPNPEDAVTDVENLDSSDSDNDAPQQGKRLIPRAVARGGKGGGLTDVEDFNASDDEGDNDDDDRLGMGGEEHSYLPSPTREIAIMRGDGTGGQTSNVMPLNHSLLLAKTPDIEQALTDFEDLDVNDDENMYDDSKYTIEALPDMDNDSVYASENSPAATKQSWVEQVHDPVTDTEDIFLDRGQDRAAAASVTFGTNELRRRRKPKGSGACTAQSYKGKTFLDTSANAQDNGPATTDVEDLYLSDDDVGFTATRPTDRSKQRRATIQVPPNQNAENAKTDIEYLSGDEHVSERTVPSPTVCPDGFRSTIKSRERLGGLHGHHHDGSDCLDDFHAQMADMRRNSPTPDAANCHTDCEEIQGASDEDDSKLGTAEQESISRAQTATPHELRRALDESGSCEIHDALIPPPMRHHVALRAYHDTQEMPTDVEFLDDDPVEAFSRPSHKKSGNDTYTEHDDALQTSARFEGDEYLALVRSEAGRLVDDVLEQSVSIVNSSQPGPMTIDPDLQPPSESEQYAIRSDILSSTDGDFVVKSPTIESMSGKSFDDNMSNPEYDALLLGTAFATTASSLGVDGPSVVLSDLQRDVIDERDGREDQESDKGEDENEGDRPAGVAAAAAAAAAAASGSVVDNNNVEDQDGALDPAEQAAADTARRAKKIDRKYARLSSDLGPEVLLDRNQEYDDAISQIKDEVSMLQSEYSKMSWDESVSVTTGDFGSSTPDNDLQETDSQLQTENNIPKTTPRIETKPIEAATVSEVSEASASGATVAIATTTAATVPTNLADDANDAAADAVYPAAVHFTASAAHEVETQVHTTSVSVESTGTAVARVDEHSSSVTTTEPEKASDSSSYEGQPVPKPRTSISSRTDTATRSSLIESFEHQDSIEQYPEPVPVHPTDADRLRQGSITSDDLSNVAQKDSSEMVTSEEDISTGAKFFIGECSSDIITRTTAEKRTDFAFDNEGYTFSHDSQGADDDARREALEVYQQQIKLEDGFTLDSLKELDIGMRSSGKPPVVHSPVAAPLVPLTLAESSQQEQHTATGTVLESTTQQYSHMTIDEMTIAKTLEEVKESLDAVQEDLIEAVTDGTPIKQSPSEFEFKILPSTRYVQDPIYETNQEEAIAVSTATAAALTTTTIVGESCLSDSSDTKPMPSGPPITIEEAPTGGSSDSSQLEVSARLRQGPHAVHAKGSRWSATDVDSSGESHYQSFEHTDSSRPLSSDIEQVLPYASSEYETALDHSIVPTSIGTEYHSAVSTLHSYPVSSHDSMKSFDSESSGNLASIESEATETLVPSTMDVDFDSSDAPLIHDDSEDDLRDKLLLLDDKEELSSAASSSIPIAMKRSHEMDFAELKSDSLAGESLQYREELEASSAADLTHTHDEKLLSSSIGTARDLVEAMQASSMEDVKMEHADEAKLGTSLEDGSILSISLSSASNLETIMENLSEKTTAAGPTHVEIGLDAVTPTTAGTTGYIGDITLTSTVLTEGDVNFLNTQATTEIIEVGADTAGRDDSEETGRKRGHKRTESTSIISGKFMAEMGENRDSIESQDESLSQDAPKPAGSERDEARDESSDSDYDRYESEYSRSFRAPVAQPKKKDKKAGEVFEKDFELDRRNSFSPSQSVIETIVEDVHAENEQGDEAQRIMTNKSQRLQEYRESSSHNIPDIHVTDDVAEPTMEDDAEFDVPKVTPASPADTATSQAPPVTRSEMSSQEETALVSTAASTSAAATTAVASASSSGGAAGKQTGIQFAKQEEYQLTEEQYQELIEQKYKAKLADTTTKYGFEADDKDDSAGSDSFEMLEQPDISDEFVIVEEVAREAHEFDAEGKSMAIKPTKIEKKHDEDVEKILVKSAPAHTNAGSMYAANMRDDMMYEFEESPPTGGAEGVEGAGVTMDLLNNGYPLEESKRWVEMQLAETQNFRYPYEDRLEDIKEEDTDFEVGSSRIGSIKDSFSSTPDYDLLAKRMASREHDDISMSSLQEFENLEHVISLENRKMQQGSQDSLSNGSFTRRFMQRGMHGDDISLSSLKEFEGLESACMEAHLIEIKAKEEAALLLSRSDESNKSNGSNGAKRSPPSNGAAGTSRPQAGAQALSTQTTSRSTVTATVVGAAGTTAPTAVVTTTVEKKTISETGRDSVSAVTATTTTVTTIAHDSQVRQVFDEEDTSHLLTVSSDSLDGTKVSKQPAAASRDTLPSAHSSSDSLEMHSKNNVDVMTSSIDSIEFSKTGMATTRSSQSDSIEHMAQQQQQPYRSDSTDSIEAQQQQKEQQQKQLHQTQPGTAHSRPLSDTKRDSLESLACSSDNQSGFSSPTKSGHGSRPLSESGTYHHQHTVQTTIASTTTVHALAGVGGRAMQKDISADSLTGPDAAFLTSTESLETSSTATNATYQNETDSQMSSSVTSCDSITMVDTVGPQVLGDEWGSFASSAGFTSSTMTASMSAYTASGVSGSSVSTTTQQQQQQQVFRSSHHGTETTATAYSASSVATSVSSSSASASSYRVGQQQMGQNELLSRALFPGEIAFDDVKETAKERMQSKSTEKEE
uniref:Uncharacterized protein n=1 Tax=Anopheles dirus TaxID=7168 RepID=A0A182NAA6_9DIPT